VVKAQKAPLSKQDEKFIKEAASGGIFEVKMGEMAEKQSSNEKVKTFGPRMVTDHSKANQELMDAAKKQGFTPPDSMNKKEQSKYDKLSKLEGTKFDREYMKNMVSDHEKDIDAFKKEAKTGQNDDIKQFAEKTTPILEEHLRMAKEVRNEVEK
jgi:putative membrane protein